MTTYYRLKPPFVRAEFIPSYDGKTFDIDITTGQRGYGAYFAAPTETQARNILLECFAQVQLEYRLVDGKLKAIGAGVPDPIDWGSYRSANLPPDTTLIDEHGNITTAGEVEKQAKPKPTARERLVKEVWKLRFKVRDGMNKDEAIADWLIDHAPLIAEAAKEDDK